MLSSHKLLLALLLLVCTTSACAQLFRRQEKQKPQDKGGTELLMSVKADATQMDRIVEETMAVIRKRCERLNIYCKLQRQSGDQIILRFSSSMETGRVKNILLSEGMEMRAVVSTPSPAPAQTYSTQAEAAEAAGTDKDVLPFVKDGNKNFVVVERTPIVTGQDVREAKAVSYTGAADDNAISFYLKPGGAMRLAAWSGANINNYLAIILNKEARTVVYIRSQISDSGEINGRFTKEEAGDIAEILMSGNLPAPVEALEEKTYKP
ncbi:MAG: hypothetical protein H7Y30_15585 [Pyrinomonadaceae bacterium]|nr:hypothetical protein [Pyrinomonadaceae bacterium]